MAGYDNTNDREVGIEWIEDYSPAYGDLEWTKEEAEGFYNRLGEKGWIKKFNYGDSSAWESDFENAFVNGYDDYYIDAFDFAYFPGHGSLDYFRFSTDHDGEVFNRRAWPVFHGLHAILGFDTPLHDQPIWIIPGIWWESPGKVFVNYMTIQRYTIGESWYRTTIEWQPSDVYGATLAVYYNDTYGGQYNDHLPGYGYVSPDVDNPDVLVYWRWQC